MVKVNKIRRQKVKADFIKIGGACKITTLESEKKELECF